MGTWIAGLMGSMFGNTAQIVSDQRTNKTNKEIQDSVNQTNREIQDSVNAQNRWAVEHTNLTNREIQESINAQNLRLQHEAWSREDNAVQRRMADLKAGGINPILAAGGAAQASGPIKLDAPHAEAPQAKAAHMEAVRMQRLQLQNDMIERAMRMRDDFATNAKTRLLLEATADEHKAKAEEIRQNTRFGQESWDTRMSSLEESLRQQGERTTLIELQQENQRLHNQYAPDVNRGVVLDNIRQEIENSYAAQMEANRVSELEKRILYQEIENMLLARDAEIYKNLGVPSTARGIEVSAAAAINERGGRILDTIINSRPAQAIINSPVGQKVKGAWNWLLNRD